MPLPGKHLCSIARSSVGALVALAASLGAQGVTVRGVAYDSLHRAPLSGAVVILASTRTTVTDTAGRFHFDSVAPGVYQIALQHDAFDSLGLSGTAVRTSVTDGSAPVALTLPSFATLWHWACRRPTPTDSGLIFGVVFGARGQPITNAEVLGGWIDIGFSRDKGLSQQNWRGETKSDALGRYYLCGVPGGTGVAVRVVTGRDTTEEIDVRPLGSIGVSRVNVTLGDPRAKGTIAGTVLGESGQPAGEAYVGLGAQLVRADSLGRFLLRDVPTGTRQIGARAIGATPTQSIVDVIANDTARVTIRLTKVTVLDSVRIEGVSVRGQRAADFEARKKMGFGSFRDSSELGRYQTITSAFATLPLKVVAGKGTMEIHLGADDCLANLWIDGVQQRPPEPHRDLYYLNPVDIAAIEVYPHMMTTPAEYSVPQSKCGSVVVWTKRAWK